MALFFVIGRYIAEGMDFDEAVAATLKNAAGQAGKSAAAQQTAATHWHGRSIYFVMTDRFAREGRVGDLRRPFHPLCFADNCLGG